LSVIRQKYLKVAYPSSNPLLIYTKIKYLGGKLIRFIRNRQIIPFINRVISVTKPSGKIYFISEPNHHSENPETNPISFMSANLWHDWPRNRRLKARLECFVDLVLSENIDILLLQELSRTNDFHADEWLSDQLGMAYIYSRSNGNAPEIGFEEGLAIYSRFPIKNHRIAQLSDQNNPFSRRMALGSSIETKLGDIDVYSVHLGILGHQNRNQFFHLRKWVEEQSGRVPAVIGGDFNTKENSPQMLAAKTSWNDSYRTKNPGGRDYSHELLWPWGNVIMRSRLDYLFFQRGIQSWKVNEARHIDTKSCPLSDHRPVLVRASISST
jgi:endonuclease/exonuclease/phosphatase family metal-dependent hydrolase